MAKTLYNPDRSTFEWAFANKPYKVPPGKSTFPDKVADHLYENTKQWGVVIYKDDSDIRHAKEVHAKKLEQHFKDVVTSFTKTNKDLLLAGVKVPEPAEVKEAKEALSNLSG